MMSRSKKCLSIGTRRFSHDGNQIDKFIEGFSGNLALTV